MTKGKLIAFLRWLWREITLDGMAERMVANYAERFPGRCMICSCHRYGVLHGHASGNVQPHDCIEGLGVERSQ